MALESLLQTFQDDLTALPRDSKGFAAQNRDVQTSSQSLIAALSECDSETLQKHAAVIDGIREEYLDIHKGGGFKRLWGWGSSRTKAASFSVLRNIDAIAFKEARKDESWKLPIFDLVKRGRLSDTRASQLVEQIFDHFTFEKMANNGKIKPFVFDTGDSKLTFEFLPNGSIQVPGFNERSMNLADAADLSFSDSIAVLRFIDQNRLGFLTEAQNMKRNKFVRKSPNCPRSLQFDTSGRIWILLNRTSRGDRVLGLGTIKTVKTAVRADNDCFEICARSTVSSSWIDGLKYAEKEVKFRLMFLDNTPGVVKTYSITNEYKGKKDVHKMAIIDKKYDNDLRTSIYRKLLEPKDRLSIARDLFIGLSNIHAKGILHRDIKPENLLVYRDNDGQWRADISDFDLACYPEEVDDHCGTPDFFAPEYIDSETFGHITNKIDIYSAGITLCELFNKDPWKMKKKQNLSKLEQFLLSMVDKEPTKRPSAEEALRLLS